MREKTVTLCLFHLVLFAVFALPRPDAQQAVLAQQQQAIVNQQAIIMVNPLPESADVSKPKENLLFAFNLLLSVLKKKQMLVSHRISVITH